MKQKDKKDGNQLLDVRSGAILLDPNQALESHYASLVYETGMSAGSGKEFELTTGILAHFIMVVCATGESSLSWPVIVGGKETTIGDIFGGFDCVGCLDPNYRCDEHKDWQEGCFAFHEAERLLDGSKDAEIRAAIESILPRDTNVFLLWDFGMQQIALGNGELFGRLDAALKSGDFKRLPKEIAELNTKHAEELVEIYKRKYGEGLKCENCGALLCRVASICVTNPSCGDEDDLIYYLCEDEDGVYFLKTAHETFEDDVSFQFEKIGQKRAEADIEAIKKCPRPDYKFCSCDTHKKYDFCRKTP